MNPEPAPEITNPPPEKTFPERSADSGEARPKKKPGLFIRFVRWFDRGIDLEGRDTSDWNIYYYYFRQVAQHRAPIKLKYLKWFALVFQLYFFGTIIFAIINGILAASVPRGAGEGFEAIPIFAHIFLGIAGLASNLLLLLPMLLLPVIVVAPAFRLRSKNRALITSRAKEPPLLAHLVQYTSHKGLVQGVLQSFLYTWKRLLILLSPCLVPILLFLVYGIVDGIVSGDLTAAAFLRFAFTPACAVLCVLAVSLFFLMQPFCYRLDSLMVAIGVGFETIMFIRFIIMFKLTPSGMVPAASAASSADFLAVSSVYVVSCLFAIVYFPLAAADTGELGLGKRTSKWIRILLYTTAGVFLALILLSKAFFASLNDSSYQGDLAEFLAMVMVWGLAICICGLLVTSMSATSPLAARQLQTRAKEPFLKKMFDPASPLSLLPALALELITLATLFILFQSEREAIRTPGTYHGVVGTIILYSCGSRARNAWTAIHFALALAYVRQRKKPEMKAPWDFHVRFNMIVLITYVAIRLFLALTSRNSAGFVGIVLYIVSLIVLFTVFGFLKSPSSTYKVEYPQSEPEQDKEEAS
ncbi:MAG: hypothetical protein J6Y92_09470 [Lentisphaeria bacterium]|nr:hypothetical protein [Lentisphaeria bacterium]